MLLSFVVTFTHFKYAGTKRSVGPKHENKHVPKLNA